MLSRQSSIRPCPSCRFFPCLWSFTAVWKISNTKGCLETRLQMILDVPFLGEVSFSRPLDILVSKSSFPKHLSAESLRLHLRCIATSTFWAWELWSHSLDGRLRITCCFPGGTWRRPSPGPTAGWPRKALGGTSFGPSRGFSANQFASGPVSVSSQERWCFCFENSPLFTPTAYTSWVMMRIYMMHFEHVWSSE